MAGGRARGVGRLALLLRLALGACARAAAPCPSVQAAAEATQMQKMLDLTHEPALSARWTGGDVGTSVPLGRGGDALWLFGDTLVGTMDGGPFGPLRRRRTGVQMPHSSAAVTSPTGSGWKVRFAVKRHGADVASLVSPPGETSDCPQLPGSAPPPNCTWLWLLSGVADARGGALLLSATHVRASARSELGFETLGGALVAVDSNAATPEAWTYRTASLPRANGTLEWGAALATDGESVLMLGAWKPGGADDPGTVVLARGPHAALHKLQLSSMEFWTKRGWAGAAGPNGEAPDDLAPLFGPAVPEASLAWSPTLGWHTLTMGFASRDVVLWTAPHVTGPWSSCGVVYTVSNAPFVDPGVLLYAPKLHPHLAVDNRTFVFTFNSNALSSLGPLYTATGVALYVPRFVVVRLSGGA